MRMAGAGAHLIVGEGGIHAPVQPVLDAPVSADGGQQSLCIGGQAAQIETAFDTRFALDLAFGFEHDEGLQLRLQFLLCPPLDLRKRVSADQHRIDRHHQQFNQIMRHLARLARVGDRDKYIG
ncbi:hypothetical protein FACS189488_02720 [Betaproteobacteria bacterium]|nr:hypothetical protein FACS189488_02720 [Betaproteobacteria bacterium]